MSQYRYDVYDVTGGRKLYERLTAGQIETNCGISRRNINHYARTGYPCQGRYRFVKVEEISTEKSAWQRDFIKEWNAVRRGAERLKRQREARDGCGGLSKTEKSDVHGE